METVRELAEKIKEMVTEEIDEYSDTDTRFAKIEFSFAGANLDINADATDIENHLEYQAGERLMATGDWEDIDDIPEDIWGETISEVAYEIIDDGVEAEVTWDFGALAKELGVSAGTLENNKHFGGSAWHTIACYYLGNGGGSGDLDGAVKGMKIAEARHATDYDARWDAVNRGDIDEQDLLEHRAELNHKIAEEIL